jgi:nucleoside-diphosphate-sugar epimerase
MLTTVEQLEEFLSRPTPLSIDAMRQMQGDLIILGIGGKMGPSLARLARRSADEAGNTAQRIIGVSRFSNPALREELHHHVIETIAGDLLDEPFRRSLPRVPNVLSMLGHKFSQQDLPGIHWAMNTYLAGLVAEQFSGSRIVAFSTGNVYPLTSIDDPAPTEATPCAPVGEYAMTAVGRERMYEYGSARHGSPTCLLRLNYAVELRYGVPVDVAQQLLAGQPIDLGMPYVNCVWQGYANAVALAAFQQATTPAAILNLTGPECIRVRDMANDLAEKLGVETRFQGSEPDRALLNDAARCHRLFGLPEVGFSQMLEMICGWLKAGGATHGKPTKFQVTDGRF